MAQRYRPDKLRTGAPAALLVCFCAGVACAGAEPDTKEVSHGLAAGSRGVSPLRLQGYDLSSSPADLPPSALAELSSIPADLLPRATLEALTSIPGFYAEPLCATCDPTMGFYLDGASFVRVSPSTLMLGKTCNAGSQCIGGCCETCRDGQWCPPSTVSVNVGENSMCPAGFHCDDFTGEKNPCEAGSACQSGGVVVDCFSLIASRRESSGQSTLDGYYCPEGSQGISECPEGHYCPNASSILICPARHYCAQKSKKPIPCSPLASCPEGSAKELTQDWVNVGLLVCLLALAAPALLPSTYRQCGIVRPPSSRDLDQSPEAKSPHRFRRSAYSQLDEFLKTDDENCLDDDAGVSIQFQDLSLYVPIGGQEVRVVSELSGSMQAGTLTAIMGSSGAGKTSFLNALCGRAYYGRRSGKVFLNGLPLRLEDHPDIVGFVPQDDTIHTDLTVRENIVFSGLFRLPQGTPMSKIQELAEETMEIFDLTSVAESLVGDSDNRFISGGQRKRVNIAVELMARPKVLFLDEPTSGLDARSATTALEALQNLASKQVTVITVIHQPRFCIYNMFDQVILLAQGGQSIYHGSPSAAVGYLDQLGYSLPEGENVADFLLDVSSGAVIRNSEGEDEDSAFSPEGNCKRTRALEQSAQRRQDLVQAWKVHVVTEKSASPAPSDGPFPNGPQMRAMPAARRKLSTLQQFQLFLQRTLVKRQRAWRFFLLDSAMVLGSQFLACIVSGRVTPTMNITNIFEFCLIANLLFNVLVTLSSMHVFADNKLIFYREAGNGYSVTAFFLANCLLDTLTATFYGIMSSLVVWAVRGSLCSAFNITALYVLVAWFSSGWSYVFSLCVPRGNLVMFSALFVVSCSTLMSGTLSFLKFDTVYSSPIIESVAGALSGGRWFVEWMTVSQYGASPAQYGYTSTANDGFRQAWLGYHDLPTIRTQNESGWFYNTYALVCFGLLSRFLAFVLIHILGRGQRNLMPIGQLLWRVGRATVAKLIQPVASRNQAVSSDEDKMSSARAVPEEGPASPFTDADCRSLRSASKLLLLGTSEFTV
ncbi:unnamed protein product [Polarella glacialis]|uniref:ABC transporter domain-containing protein n=1 Tax=Polarella glacialis TaxID=89957 RepID=A0A813HTZ8_POLGL|nr:unnamed protein product [Polarella glacialis]